MPVRVSVVVPLYNKAQYVLRTLESISAQSLADFEAIIVDDGSTDGSAELAMGYRDERFRVIRQENAGPASARNRGVAAAGSGLVAFLDADDTWMPEYLRTGVELLEACGPEVAATASGYVMQPGGKSSESLWRRRGLRDGVHRVGPKTEGRRLAYMAAYMTMSSTIARTSSIRRWGGFYEKDRCRYGEDAALWLKVLLNEAVYFKMEPLVHLDLGASSLGSNFRGPRPVEPFLSDPEDIEKVCPAVLLPVLRAFYARSAAKTAALYGAWGQTAMARRLMRRHVRPGNVSPGLLCLGLLACTPLAGPAGRLFRPMLALGQRRWASGGRTDGEA